MADRSIAQHYFHDVLVHRVVKLLFSNKYFSDSWLPDVLINMISTHSWCESKHFMLRGYQAIVLHRSPGLCFCSNSIVFIATVGFSSEDNCCQSEGIGKPNKNAFKRYFESWLTYNVAANTTSFFLQECFLGSFFPKSCLKVGGAAYTWVRLIYECLRYFIVYYLLF